MSVRVRNTIALVAALVVLLAAVLFVSRSRRAPKPVAAVDLVPADARVVVSANLTALRLSPFARVLADQRAGAHVGCDRDALDRASDVVVWLPGDTPDQFGVAAVGDFQRDELIACSRSTIAKRGGHPSISTEGDYTVVGDDDLGADAARIAARQDGVLLLGRPSVRTRMAAVGAGWSPSAAFQGQHARMRAAAGSGDVVLTAVVDRSVRETVQRLVGFDAELEGVQSVAAVMQAGPQAQVRAIAWCDTADACQSVRAGLEARRVAISSSAVLRAAGLAALADATTVERHDAMVDVTLRAPASQIAEVVERIAHYADQEPAPQGPSAAPPGALPPDEVVRAPGSASPAGSSK